MKIINKLLTTVFFLLTIISFQSCDWFQETFQIKRIKQHGYITDTLSNGISDVKITILKSDNWTGNGEETEMVFYTDETGYYKIKIDNTDYVYRMKMTHDEYIYPIPQPQILYPQISPGITDEDRNYQMVKLGKVKIEGDVRFRYPDLTFYWLENVKISILKRPNGSTNYPDTTGIKTFSDANGQFYIEYEGDKNYEFFLKPEKAGYYYDRGSIVDDCGNSENYDPGYVISYGFDMKKE